MAQHDYILIGGPVKQQGGFRQQGVKPSSGLVHRLGDELGGELLFKRLLILKGIMVLGKGHGPGVKPAVNYLRHPVHGFSAVGALDGNGVNIGTVQLHRFRALISGKRIQLFPASHGNHVAAVLALPDV